MFYGRVPQGAETVMEPESVQHAIADAGFHGFAANPGDPGPAAIRKVAQASDRA